ncbi:SRPBCC family protein [Sporosarcina oncorhynchi]|uniref:SRPBCC family protein n=1 Tax=Sporosarcina oncorhynchi TaxID=3056444 RepID=A0ABZ0LAC9_9BACL|nr:SRPBCC family protein [Sporosarcina sp. T2O-4]WOV89105.1 SRPBCC family protein [Sporosarcina sp. T2O-4]
MLIIHHEVYIEAPIHVCFDLARNVDVHTVTTAKTKERAIGGVTEGLMQLGDTVTWEAVHFGIKQRLTAKIIQMDTPYSFTDVMVSGAFQSFTHVHTFRKSGNGTIMEDNFTYTSPLGFIGKIADSLFLERYMRKFLVDRAMELKKIAESK